MNRSAILLLSVFVASACADPDPIARAGGTAGDDAGSSDGEPVEIDEEEILRIAENFEDELVELSIEREQSEVHSDAASVFVWGNSDAADVFHSIDPSDPTQPISFEEGTTFIKEHFDVNDERVGLTIMYKAPAGYDPEWGDWFWARIRGERVTHQGRVDWCQECHEVAHNSDFVVGFGKSN